MKTTLCNRSIYKLYRFLLLDLLVYILPLNGAESLYRHPCISVGI